MIDHDNICEIIVQERNNFINKTGVSPDRLYLGKRLYQLLWRHSLMNQYNTPVESNTYSGCFIKKVFNIPVFKIEQEGEDEHIHFSKGY